MCHIPHHAVTNNIPPIIKSGGNMVGLKSSTRPKPEFWMPVSIVSVRRFLSVCLNNAETLYPVSNKMALCISTIMNMYFM